MSIYIYSVAWVCEPTSGARPTQLRRCARASPHFPSGSVFIFRSAYPISPRSGEHGFHFFIPTRYSFCSLALPVQFHRVGGSVVSVFFFQSANISWVGMQLRFLPARMTGLTWLIKLTACHLYCFSTVAINSSIHQ